MQVLILFELIVGIVLVTIYAFTDLGRDLSRRRYPVPPPPDEEDLAP